MANAFGGYDQQLMEQFRFQQGISQNKNTNDLLNPKSNDYIGKDLYKFIPDSAEIMKGL
jgi:hypothetical protein